MVEKVLHSLIGYYLPIVRFFFKILDYVAFISQSSTLSAHYSASS